MAAQPAPPRLCSSDGGDEGDGEKRLLHLSPDAHSCSCCCVRFALSYAERRLFLQKCALVIIVTFALFPLVRMKSSIPKLTFTLFLVGLHVVVLIVYLYRVKFRALDPDWRSVAARVLALLLMIGLLFLVARNERGSDLVLALEMLGLCCIHTVVLLLLMVRVRYKDPPEDVDADAGRDSS
eukprot:TRINITY_DN13892_c0_g1_i1.p1 TRINITY_DN13892_c0_g1~~TRINITY_DN13892_c0_g1_i1.p1  ORF type:complete len:206 (+),score=76.00 TRINITY_DN13892_c0_g1_i1:76-618(+)